MIDASWKYDEIAFLHKNANPPVLWITNIKVSTPIQNKTNFFIRMQMFFKKYFQLQIKAKTF